MGYVFAVCGGFLLGTFFGMWLAVMMKKSDKEEEE